MVGAMPAVAVRQQRKHGKPEETKQRPSTLTIEQSTPLHQGIITPVRSPRVSPDGSPVPSHFSHKNSPISPVKLTKTVQIKSSKIIQRNSKIDTCLDYRFFGIINLVHISVILVALGILFSVWGVVLFVPGSRNGFVNKYAILGVGMAMLVTGFSLLIFQCLNFQIKMKAVERNEVKQRKVMKKRKVKSKCHMKNGQKQIQTIDGSLATVMTKGSRTKAEVHPITPLPITDFKIVQEYSPMKKTKKPARTERKK